MKIRDIKHAHTAARLGEIRHQAARIRRIREVTSRPLPLRLQSDPRLLELQRLRVQYQQERLARAKAKLAASWIPPDLTPNR